MRCVGTTALFLAASLVAGTAHAQDASRAAEAQALFDEGRALMAAGKLAEACAKLQTSETLDPQPGTLLNLAACYEKNGQTASAWATYTLAAPESRKAGHADWEAQARERAAALARSVSHLTIHLAPGAEVPGLTIEKDGARMERGELELALPVDPGAHTIVASAPQHASWSGQVDVGPDGARAELTIPLLPAIPAPTPPEPDTRTAPGSTQRGIGIALVAAGGVGLVVGAAFGLAARSVYRDATRSCTPNDLCPQDALDRADTARSDATASTIAFGLGAAALIGGAVLYLIAPRAVHAASRLSPVRGGGLVELGAAW